MISGCSTVSMKDNLITIDDDFFMTEKQPPLAAQFTSKRNSWLEDAFNQVNGKPNQVNEKPNVAQNSSSEDTGLLPIYLAGEPLIKKIITAAHQARHNSSGAEIEIPKSDISSMIKLVGNQFGAKENLTDDSDDEENRISKIINKYLMVYYTDSKLGFVNREGIVYKRPEIKDSIGNDVITAVIAIVFEGIFDGVLDTPVYVDNQGKFQTQKGTTPTAITLNTITKTPTTTIVSRGDSGINDLELKAIRYLSGLAGDQSKILSGAAFRGFGGLELSLVIGGKFSFGDNDTTAKVLDTIFEISAKRIVEEKAYHGFSHITTNNYRAATKSCSRPSKAESLLCDFEKMK